MGGQWELHIGSARYTMVSGRLPFSSGVDNLKRKKNSNPSVNRYLNICRIELE